jgi:hypothetical protein
LQSSREKRFRDARFAEERLRESFPPITNDYVFGTKQDLHAPPFPCLAHPRRAEREVERAEPDSVIDAFSNEKIRAAEESRDELGLRPEIKLVGTTDFQEAAGVHDPDAISELECFLLIMGHEDRGNAELPLDLADRSSQFGADSGIEGAERFVEQQDLRIASECARQRHALLLASRELPRIASAQSGQSDQLEQLFATLLPIGFRPAPDPEREVEILPDRHLPEERVVLEYESDAAGLWGEIGDVPSRDHDPSRINVRESRDHPQDRALSAPARPEEDEELAVLDLQREPADSRMVIEAFDDMLEGYRHRYLRGFVALRSVVFDAAMGSLEDRTAMRS